MVQEFIKKVFDIKNINTFLMYTPDSEPIPFIFNPSLGVDENDKLHIVYKNEALFYDDLYLALKVDGINMSSKYLLLWNKGKLLLQKCDLGFSLDKLPGHENIYYFKVKNITALFDFPTIEDTREKIHKDSEYIKCRQELNKNTEEINKITNEANEQLNQKTEILEKDNGGQDSINLIQRKITEVEESYQKYLTNVDSEASINEEQS